eukprot:2295404-Amphidinium_carterae.1
MTGMVSQPKFQIVRFWYVACVRTLVCRTLAATLLKRPDLRSLCPGAWTLHLDIFVTSYSEPCRDLGR